jgi:hypothetical protein
MVDGLAALRRLPGFAPSASTGKKTARPDSLIDRKAMTLTLIALGALVWLFFLVLCFALARAAALGDLLLGGAVAAKRERHRRRAA